MRKIRSGYLLVSSLIISFIQFPIHAARVAMAHVLPPAPAPKPMLASPAATLSSSLASVYDSLQLNLYGLSRTAYDYACKGFSKLLEQGRLSNDSVLSIADFSEPSSRKRLFILDIRHHTLLFNTLVAHGRNSGRETTTSFSNRPASYKSSPGFYLTADTYTGNNGRSLRLQGLEPGINDRAYDRGIVVHGAPYVSDSYVQSQGYIGRSEGCPAVPVAMAPEIIRSIQGGSCFFIYHPAWAGHSQMAR